MYGRIDLCVERHGRWRCSAQMENSSSTANWICCFWNCAGFATQGNDAQRRGPASSAAERDHEHGHHVFLAGNLLDRSFHTKAGASPQTLTPAFLFGDGFGSHDSQFHWSLVIID